MPELAWYEFNRRDQPVIKRREFPTSEALQKFAAKIAESANFYQFYGTSD